MSLPIYIDKDETMSAGLIIQLSYPEMGIQIKPKILDNDLFLNIGDKKRMRLTLSRNLGLESGIPLDKNRHPY